MQDRYVGDIGDYVKLALLRALSPGRRLGIGWYLTADEAHNSDGRHIGYLRQPERWRDLDPGLFDELKLIVDKGRRCVEALEQAALDDATFHNTRLVSPSGRSAWFAQLQERMAPCDLVFLDPDNGLEPTGFRTGTAKSIKSVTYDEIARLRRPGRALVIYHHQTRMAGGHEHEIRHLAERLGRVGARNVIAVRGRPYSARVFFVIDGDEQLTERARSFAARWHGHVSLYEGLCGATEAGHPAVTAHAVDDAAAAGLAAHAGESQMHPTARLTAPTDSACPFCTLPDGRVVDANEHGFVIRDLYPVSPGHTLVIPRRHVGSFFDATADEQASLLSLLHRARSGLMSEISPDGFNIGINDGSAAGQTVPHLHIHLIPRFAGDRPDPRGGIRWIMPERADYWSKA